MAMSLVLSKILSITAMAVVKALVSAFLASVRLFRSARICCVSLRVLVVSLSWGEINAVM